MKKIMKILGVVVVLLAAAAVTVVALVTQYDYNQLKPRIEAMAEQATGRKLTIGGDLDLRVSLQPTLRVGDVTFANAGWATGGADMVKLDQLDAKLDLMSLLQGRVDVDYIVVDGLDVVLETSKDRRANWEFEVQDVAPDAAQAGGLLLIPNVRDVRVLDAHLTYIDGLANSTMTFDLTRATVRADGFDAPIHATLEAAFRDVVVNAAVDMGSAAHLVGAGGEPFPVNIDVTAPGVSANVEGTVEQPRQGLGVNAHVDVRVTDSAALDRLAGTALPDLSGLIARFAVAGEGTSYRFSAIDARVHGSDVAGDVAVDIAGARPSVKGKVTSKVMDLDALLGLEAPKPAKGGAALPTKAPTGEAPKLFSRAPLPLDALKAFDADLELFAGQVKATGLTVNAAKARVQLNNGRLALPDYAFTLEGGDVEGTARLDAGGGAPALSLDTKVRTLDVGRVLAALGQGSMLTLPLSGEVNLKSQGESPYLLAKNLNGRARFAAENGRFDDTALKSFTTGVGSILPWAKQADGSVISCVIADWPVKGGVATAETVVMDTPGFAVAVTGNVDLGGELLHLTVVPKAKQTSLASFAVPVRIKGAFTQPYVDVDPGDLVVGTVGNIVKAPATLLGDILGGVLPKADAQKAAANPCLQGAGGAQQPAQPAPADGGQLAPPPATEPTEPKNPVDALGKALGGFLGK